MRNENENEPGVSFRSHDKASLRYLKGEGEAGCRKAPKKEVTTLRNDEKNIQQAGFPDGHPL